MFSKRSAVFFGAALAAGVLAADAADVAPSIQSDNGDIQFVVAAGGKVSVLKEGVLAGDVQTSSTGSLTDAIRLGMELGKEIGQTAAGKECAEQKAISEDSKGCMGEASDRLVVAAIPRCGGEGGKCRVASGEDSVQLVVQSKYKEKALAANIAGLYTCRFEHGVQRSIALTPTHSPDGTSVTCAIPGLDSSRIEHAMWTSSVALVEGGSDVVSKRPLSVDFVASAPVLTGLADLEIPRAWIDANTAYQIHYGVEDADSLAEDITVSASVSNTDEYSVEVIGQPGAVASLALKLTFLTAELQLGTDVTVTATDNHNKTASRTFTVSLEKGRTILLVVEQGSVPLRDDPISGRPSSKLVVWKSTPLVESEHVFLNSEGGLEFTSAGTAKFDFHGSFMHSRSYMTVYAILSCCGSNPQEHTVVTQELMANTHNIFDGISVAGSVAVEAGHTLVFKVDNDIGPTSFRSGTASVVFFSEESGVESWIGRGDSQYSGGSQHFSTYMHQQRTMPLSSWLSIPPSSDNTFRAAKQGIVVCDLFQDIIGGGSDYDSFWLKLYNSPDSAINEHITNNEYVAELIHYTTDWDGVHYGAVFPVDASTTFEFHTEARHTQNLDDGIWAPLTLLYLPHTADNSNDSNDFEYILAELSNADALKQPGGSLEKVANFKQISSSNPTTISIQDGELHAHESGVVSFDYHQDMIHDCELLTLKVVVNGVTYAREGHSHTTAGGTSSNWDGISLGFSVPVRAGEKVQFFFVLENGNCQMQSVDQGRWARMSALWIRG